MDIRHNAKVQGVVCGLAAAVIWGGFPVMTRLGVAFSTLDMYDVTFLRFAVSGLILAPFLLRTGFGGLGIVPVALMVAGVGAPYMLAVAHGLALAPAGLFALLTPGGMIAFSVVLSVVWLKRTLPLHERIGLGVIAVGIVLAAWQTMHGGTSMGAAALFLVLGGFLWAVYTVATRAFSVGALHATAIVSVVSALVYSPVYFVMKGFAILHAPLGELATQALYQGILVSVVALYLFSRAVALLGATVGASFAALVPTFAMIEASALLGEVPGAPALAALVLVTAGMVISVIGSRFGAAQPARETGRALR